MSHTTRSSLPSARFRFLGLGPLHSWVPALALLTLALLCPVSLNAQGDAADEDDSEVFFETVDVNVVNVEVFVTDRKGVPITGLTKDDFELRENGKPVEITNFLAVKEDRDVSAGTASAGDQAFSLPEDQRLHAIVFLDNLNTTSRNRNQVLDHLRRFLRTGLDNEDRVMLVSFDGKLDILQEFTSVPELIQPMLEQQEEMVGRALEVEQARRQILSDMSSTTIETGQRVADGGRSEALQVLSAIQVFSQQTQDRNRYTLSALESLVNSLSGLPGRKALLYVSDGLPLRPGEALFQAWSDKYGEELPDELSSAPTGEAIRYDNTEDYRRLIAHANGNRVMFYTIDAARNRSFGAVDAETGGFDLGALDTPSGGRSWTSELDDRLNANYRGGLRMLAEETGGQSFINTRGLSKTLTKLAHDFNTYYSLGYRPAHDGDGKYHRLEVKLKKGKGKLRHRAGYRDKTRAERMSDRTMSALLLNISDNPLAVIVERADDELREDGTFNVPLLVKIPLGKIALLPDEEFHQGKVSVYIVVSDSSNRTSPVRTVEVPIKIPNDRVNEAMEQFAGYTFTLQMREGFQRVAVGVRDEVASTDSTVRMSFRVGS